MGQLEVADLQDHGQGLADVDEAHKNQDQRHVQGKGQTADDAAQEQAAGIAHEDLGRMPVVEQVSDQTAHQRRGQQSQIKAAHGYGGGGEEHQHGNGDGATQAVHTVGNVHRVVTADHDEHGEEDVHNGMNVKGYVKERDVQMGVHAAAFEHDIQEQSGHCHLQHGFLQGGQA